MQNATHDRPAALRARRVALTAMTALWPLAVSVVVGGCRSDVPQPRVAEVEASDSRPLMMSSWSFDGRAARTVRTTHYAIHTTIDDPEFLESLGRVMEGSYAKYRELVPGVAMSPKPLESYVFSRRAEWVRYTEQNTGDDSAIYLQINRGGYTVHDWFVAYYIGDVGTYAVASHEGWHQFVARNFHSRLPPFLEEGIATAFENIGWNGGTPQWRLGVNPNRARKLRTALRDGLIWPLDQLCTMHAGDVVNLSGERIETFYAQDWAFAQFMWRGENGAHRAAFQKMLSDLASGASDIYTNQRRNIPPDSWDPRTVRPLLEHYLGMNMEQIDKAYQAYIRKIAFGGRDDDDPT